MASLAARVEAATPPERDRGVDALRALAVLGVVLGHWLVTALVLHGDDALGVTSPLVHMPELAPVSWVLQPLAVFFFVGGYGAARRLDARARWRRIDRLWRPAAVLLLAWIPLGLVLAGAGFGAETLRTLATLVISPLWFLAVYALMIALTPVADAVWRRLGLGGAALPFAVVLVVDVARFGSEGPAALGWLNVVAGWAVPYVLGVAWARGGLSGRSQALGLLAGGALATAVLIAVAGYPASMVGIPGAPISNLNPPTLAVVTFGLAQIGLALLLRGPLDRLMRRPLAWTAVAMANLSAMTIFVWHQTALIVVTLAGSALGTLPGLHDPPSDLGWIADRAMWLPVFAAVLTAGGQTVKRWETRGGSVDRAMAVSSRRRSTMVRRSC